VCFDKFRPLCSGQQFVRGKDAALAEEFQKFYTAYLIPI
jgi:hypothetical protein